ncbi:hypothetical protein ACIA8E_23610 [Streptomyces sp. NPDC051664]|uniref:hypothetical protein n=1 Tax=Streptomyces sp. NPDC051664 TaxID=3365668 RepID=UPI0037B1622B
MRPIRRRTWALLAASVAVAALVVPLAISGLGWPGASAPTAPVPDPHGADCRTSVQGSWVVAYCHNPYPTNDRVQLHTECDRWWDIDADGIPVDVAPGQTVRLDDRCWKEIASVWITHQRI